MKKTYKFPYTCVYAIISQNILANSIVVNGTNKIDTDADIGFVREENFQDVGSWEDY